ncbi:MAG: RNase adapter RapZ [Eubacteriales bacterium]|nr:RNase adapter RapZ [Eubacteriales bacterium]
MRFIIVTGMSGAGKSQAANCFEDMGYYCIDNMPGELIYTFAELCDISEGQYDKVALVCDVRGGSKFDGLLNSLENMKTDGLEFEVLYLDATDETLISRYKETRRRHPLEHETSSLSEAIAKERQILAPLRDLATDTIDTTGKSSKQTAGEIKALYSMTTEKEGISIVFVSFGFKHGIPRDCDMLFDVRFLPNPFYITELRMHNGTESCVSDYVMSFDVSIEFEKKLCDMMDFLLPQYVSEGRANLVVGIGCTGGNHRSVTFAELLNKYVNEKGYRCQALHRDIDKR